MATKNISKQAFLWAAIAAVLSLFIFHRPANPNDPLDRLVAGAIVMFVSALLGGIGGGLIAWLRHPEAPQAPRAAETNQIQPIPNPVAAPILQPLAEEAIEKLGVSKEGGKYRYKTYIYDRLEDAINYARLDRSRVHKCK